MSPYESFVDSCAVVVVREGEVGLEVLLVERAPELRFFGGYWAFPGGGVDPVDRPGEPGAAERCARRELFEETGLGTPTLLAALGPDADRVRVDLLGGEAESWALVDERVPIEPGELRPIGRLTTPPFVLRRHRTRFFLLAAPEIAEPTVRAGELVGAEFVDPARALAEWRRGERRIVPPVLYALEQLRTKTADEFARRFGTASAALEAGTVRLSYLTPGVGLVPLRTPTIPPATTTNCYVVGEERRYVVDPATPDPAEQERLFELLEDLGPETLAGVFVTHHHPDHVGAVAAVARRYDLPVLGHERTLARLPEAPADARTVRDGDVLDLGRAPDGTPGWHATAHATPGHDRGHLVLLESRYGALVAGDLVSTLSTIVIDPPEGHLATYLDSLRRVAALDVRTILPAHGPGTPRAKALLRRYLAHRAQREEALLAALEEPRTPAELVPLVYASEDPRVYPLAERSLVAGLEKLEGEGRAARRGDAWVRIA